MTKSKRKILILNSRYFTNKLSTLNGEILELGYGNGDNFQYYNQNSNVIAVDKKSGYQPSWLNNITTVNEKITTDLPFNTSQFNYIVFKFFFCTILNKHDIIKEMHRVLKDNGQIIYLEHISSSNLIYKAIQQFLTPFTRLFYGNCSLNNSIEIFLESLFKRIEKKQIKNHIEPYEFGVWEKHST